jgi:hypothetical protein
MLKRKSLPKKKDSGVISAFPSNLCNYIQHIPLFNFLKNKFIVGSFKDILEIIAPNPFTTTLYKIKISLLQK